MNITYSVMLLLLVLLAAMDAIAEEVKPGRCPRMPTMTPAVRRCRRGCTDDPSCPGNLKCCAVGCTRVCMMAIGRQASVLPTTPWPPSSTSLEPGFVWGD